MADDNIDDIFRSFVSQKMEQLGMSRSEGAGSLLEDSLRSALGSGRINKETTSKEKKHKKKKHKREKQRKEKGESQPSGNNSQKQSIRSNEIKEKNSNFYFETLTEVEEIKKLPLMVEPSQTGEPVINVEPSQTNQPVIPIGPSQTNQPVIPIGPSQTGQPVEAPATNCPPLINGVSSNFKHHGLEVRTADEKDSTSNHLNISGQPVIKVEYDKKKEDKSQKDDKVKKEGKSQKEDKGQRRKRSRSRSKERRHRRRRHRSRSRSPRRHKHLRRRSRSRSRSRDRHQRSHRASPVISREDKVKLLEIAKANVLAQHRAGLALKSLSQENKATLRFGTATVSQLTGVCKDIVEGKREIMAVPPPKHPFAVKEAAPIAIKINQTHYPPPVAKPISELSKAFPVSSGSQHQRKEVLEEVYGRWEAVEDTKVFPEAVERDSELMIKDVIAQRVHAARELQSDPGSSSAIQSMAESQQQLDRWTTSKHVPGQFLGSTGVQPLCRSEFQKGNPAWANTTSLNAGKQVGGVGRSLLQKMGWKEGESLGRNNAGMLEPLKLNVKTDRKGLAAVTEVRSRPVTPHNPRDLSGKHPVSALMEICSKRHWGAPEFTLVDEEGPDHSRMFRFKVLVNGDFYRPSVSSVNKKTAKATAATAALQAMGLVPK